jgi:hypothetical protein
MFRPRHTDMTAQTEQGDGNQAVGPSKPLRAPDIAE